MTDGVPVVISDHGIPVRQVTSGAPQMTVSPNGRGVPIRISDRGVPFIVSAAEISFTGSGYAGSTYTAPAAGQWYADGVPISGETGQTFVMTLALEGAAITQESAGNTIQLWVPTSGMFSAVFDIRRNITLADSNVTAWGSVVNGVVAAQATAASQPVYDGSGMLGGPAIVFSNDFFSTQSDMPGSGGDITVIGLAEWVGDGGAIVAGNNAGTYIVARVSDVEGGKLAIGVDGVGFALQSTTMVPRSSPLVFSAKLESGSSYAFRTNGVDNGTGSTSITSIGDGTMRVGRVRTSGRFFNGPMSSILIARSYLDDDIVEKAEAWIAYTTNSVSLLPPDHPYKTEAPRVQ